MGLTDRGGVPLTVRAAAVNLVLLLAHAYLGSGPVIGPPRAMSSTTFFYALQVAPPVVWGWLMLAGIAPTVAAPWVGVWGSAACHGLAAAPFAVFAVLLARAEWTGVAQGWGGPLLYGSLAAGHLLIVRARFERRARVSLTERG